MNSKQALGKRGELLIEKSYLNLGYKLLARNWRSGRRELDLIFTKNGGLVFIEVKSRNFSPLDFEVIPLAKKQIISLKRAILDYCYLHKISTDRASLDLVLVIFKEGSREITIKKYHNILS